MKHEPATVGRKVCKKCNEEKSVLAFDVAANNRDGIRNVCRPCTYEHYIKPRDTAKKQTGEIRQVAKYRW